MLVGEGRVADGMHSATVGDSPAQALRRTPRTSPVRPRFTRTTATLFTVPQELRRRLEALSGLVDVQMAAEGWSGEAVEATLRDPSAQVVTHVLQVGGAAAARGKGNALVKRRGIRTGEGAGWSQRGQSPAVRTLLQVALRMLHMGARGQRGSEG